MVIYASSSDYFLYQALFKYSLKALELSFFQKKMAAVRSLGRINPKTSAVFLCDMQVFIRQ